LKKALITEEFHPYLTEGLSGLGFHCEQQWLFTTADVKDCIHEFEILVVNSKIVIDRDLLERAAQLKTIVRIGSGLEMVDRELCKEKNITLISTPEGNANAVAEHVLAFILSAYTNLYRAQKEMIDGLWMRESNRGEELSGKVVAIIGCGNNGSRLVNLLSGFETEVLVYDIVNVSGKLVNPRARQTEMDEIFRCADVVSFHIPLNQDTRYLVCAEYLAKFNKPIDLVNTSRGGICKETDLWHGLENGYIRRALLDVYDSEPVKLSEGMKKFIQEGKLFVTPHIAGWTQESKMRMAELAISKLRASVFL